MLTIFSIPKPFRGHIGVIQRNAIQSWLQVCPACEVILFGDEEGTAEAATRFDIRHMPEIECNEYGTPLLNSLFDKAQQVAKHRLLCYVNGDIILMSDFMQAVGRIRARTFLLAGRRWRLDMTDVVNFEDQAWETRLRANVLEGGKLDSLDAIDYFVFTRGLYQEMPPFAVGRPAWDNWMIFRARSLGVPVIDATETVMAIHQNHDYPHHPQGKAGIFEGPEARKNQEIAGGLSHAFTLQDASWILGPHGLRPALSYTHLRRRKDTLPILFPQGGFRVIVLKYLLSFGMNLHIWLLRLRPRRLAAAALRRAIALGGKVVAWLG